MNDDIFDDMWRIEGLFVGQLDDKELDMFNTAVEAGKAERCYEGMAGFLGLATVKVLHVQGAEVEQEALDS